MFSNFAYFFFASFAFFVVSPYSFFNFLIQSSALPDFFFVSKAINTTIPAPIGSRQINPKIISSAGPMPNIIMVSAGIQGGWRLLRVRSTRFIVSQAPDSGKSAAKNSMPQGKLPLLTAHRATLRKQCPLPYSYNRHRPDSATEPFGRVRGLCHWRLVVIPVFLTTL